MKLPKIIAVSERIYRKLLRLYPAPHRRDYGEQMAQLFRDQCRDAWQEGGSMALVKLWLRVLPDIAKTSMKEQINSIERNTVMKFFNAKNRPTVLLIAGLALAFLSFSRFVMPVDGAFCALVIISSLAILAKAAIELFRPANEWPVILLRTFVLMFFYALFMPAWAKMKLHDAISPVSPDVFGYCMVACLMANPLVAGIKFAQFFVLRQKG